MELLAVSKDAIRAHVIRYFHDVFHTPIFEFKPGTNVRNAYSYADRAWSQLANVFNKLSWMRQLGVLLSPREMPDLSTIEDLTSAIWGKLRGHQRDRIEPALRSKARPEICRAEARRQAQTQSCNQVKTQGVQTGRAQKNKRLRPS